MAVTSGLYMSPEGEAADIYYNELCDIFQDRFDRDISDELSTDFLEEFVLKYNAILLPKGPRARSKFEEVLDELSKLQVMGGEVEDTEEGEEDEGENFMYYIELGDKYLEGQGVDMDAAEAVKCYAMALTIMGADESVQQRFDDMHSKGIEIDLSRLLQPANEEADAQSQFLLGNLHSKIKGEGLSVEEGVKWYTLAAENDHPGAQKNGLLAQWIRLKT